MPYMLSPKKFFQSNSLRPPLHNALDRGIGHAADLRQIILSREKTVFLIARACGVTITEFFGGESFSYENLDLE